jgi:hypothetical protein
VTLPHHSLHHHVRAIAAAALLLAAPGGVALAQRRISLDVALPQRAQAATEGPIVTSSGMLGDNALQDLLRNGFPARMHYRAELWSIEGFSNDLRRATEWDVVLRYDPLDRTYRASQLVGDHAIPLGQWSRFEDAEQVLERPYRAPIAPRDRRGRMYYSVALDVETLSMSDLDEVERWLRGEFRPAVRLKKNPGTAVGRGVRTLLVRLLGGDKRHYERRSAIFEVR